jgi:hypothetical protein
MLVAAPIRNAGADMSAMRGVHGKVRVFDPKQNVLAEPFPKR